MHDPDRHGGHSDAPIRGRRPRWPLALGLIAIGAWSCEDGTSTPDGGATLDASSTEAGGTDVGGSPDGGGDGGAGDAGPAEHPCDALSAELQALLDEAARYDAFPSSAAVLASAAEIATLEHREHVSTLVIEGLETILADPTDPVHATATGADYLRGARDREQAALSTIRASLASARASAPDDQLRTPEGVSQVLDAVLWRSIGNATATITLQCETDRSALTPDSVEDFVLDMGSLIDDAEGGHGVARARIVQDILAGRLP